jgi:5-methyltetrahydropteroyltriglutamate--homocysteine methyltransferase
MPSEKRILTTHVGSLVRPAALRDLMGAREREVLHDKAQFDSILKQAVVDVVRKQAEVDIDIINDGEFGKTGWNRYVAERMTGFIHRVPRQDERAPTNLTMIGEVTQFPEFYAAYDYIQKFNWVAPDRAAPKTDDKDPPAPRMLWECVGPIGYQGQQAIARDIDNLRTAMRLARVERGFLPVAAPMSARGLWINSYYPDEEAIATALSDALAHEYRAIAEAGLFLQIDDAFLADQYEHLGAKLGDKGRQRYLERRIELLNHALAGIPEERIRYHVCWGSWNGPHTTDVPLKTILGLILKVRAHAYSIEAANPRHEHEWQVWKEVRLPEGKTLIPGLVSHCTNVVEHPELVAWRIENFASVVGRDNIIAGTDCGFSQSYNHVRVHPSIQWAKLGALVEGARMATRKLWMTPRAVPA